MKLLTGSDILTMFQKHVKASKKIDISVAWITNSEPLNLLRELAVQNNIETRVIVGLDDDITRPTALSLLLQFAEVRIAESKNGIFHPKMYIFHLADKIVVWVGSANFTHSGFRKNEELISEVSVAHQEAIGWFNNRWKSIDKTTSYDTIQEYSKNWLPPKQPRKQSKRAATVMPDSGQQYSDINLDCSWGEYIKLIDKMNSFWIQASRNYSNPFSVTEDTASYMETISDGNLLVNYPTWDSLSDIESVMLLGLNDKYGVHGLLGSMRGAGRVKNIFLESSKKNLEIRQKIFSAVRSTIPPKNKQDYLDAAQEALKEIISFDGFGIGAATRLLALARSDMAISVNKASCSGLAKLSGLKPGTIMNWERYPMILNWLYSLDWYNSPEPADPWENAIWSKRAALIDCFVYDDRMAQTHSRLS